MNIQSFGTSRIPILGLPLGSHEEKLHLNVVLVERRKIYYREGNGGLIPKVVGHVKFMPEVIPIKFIAPLPFNLH